MAYYISYRNGRAFRYFFNALRIFTAAAPTAAPVAAAPAAPGAAPAPAASAQQAAPATTRTAEPSPAPAVGVPFTRLFQNIMSLRGKVSDAQILEGLSDLQRLASL